MAAKKQTDPKPKAVGSLTELAAWCGKSRRTIQTWSTRDGFPVLEGGDFSPFLIGCWFATRGPGAASSLGSDDPDMEPAAGPSPALEEYRRHRARREKIEVAKLEGKLLEAEFVEAVFATVSTALRRAGEKLNKGASSPAELLEHTIAEIERAGRQWIGDRFGSDEG